jgi:phage tail-like protein
MAVSSKTIKTDYPLPVYNYRVDIGEDTIGFSEVSGLSIEYERQVYKESSTEAGKPGPKIFIFPGQPTVTTLTMKKGLVPPKSKAAFYDWIKGLTTNQIDKKDILISLCDETGKAVVTWTVQNAFPTKLDVPSFDANSNDVAIETLELSADGLTIDYQP